MLNLTFHLAHRHKSDLQRGSVLFVSLIVLIVMTLIVLTLLRGAVIELKIGGATQYADTLFNAAESTGTAFINQNNGRFTSNCLTAADSSQSCFTDGAGNLLSGTLDPSAARAITAPLPFQQGGVTLATTVLTIRQGFCGPDAEPGSGNQLGNQTLQAVHFDLEAHSSGQFQENALVGQGFKALLPAGSCS